MPDIHFTVVLPPNPKKSRLPPALRFPLVVVPSLALTAVGYSAIVQWTKDELSAIVRSLSNIEGVAAKLATVRLWELWTGWSFNFDRYDLAAVTILSHGPTISWRKQGRLVHSSLTNNPQLYLLSAFYHVRPLTAAACLSVDVLSSVVPSLLSPLSAAHQAAPTVPNRIRLVDRTVRLYTILLATSIYIMALALSYGPFLRNRLLLYFVGIPSIEPSSSPAASVFSILLAGLFGLAARTFIFVPTAAAVDDHDDEDFVPVAAAWFGTPRWSASKPSAKSMTLILRTVSAAVFMSLRTSLQCQAIRGVEQPGAAAYAVVWVTATLLTGNAFAFVLF